MAVKLRMTRMGKRHRPFFRINAVEARTPRDGKVLEKLGHYDPIEKDPAKQVVLNRERAEYWLGIGAIPSDTVSQILLKQGIKHKYAEQKAKRLAKAKHQAHAKGKFFTKAEKIASEKEAEKKAKEAEEKTKAGAKAKEAERKAKDDTEAKPEEKTKAEPKPKVETKVKEEKDTGKVEVVEEKVEAKEKKR
jgi:small subunit ribosomal protein S16